MDDILYWVNLISLREMEDILYWVNLISRSDGAY